MDLTLKIQSENAAFVDDGNDGRSETARILREAADKIEKGADSGKLYDVNGNPVGNFSLSD